jgi:SAM-dependent methyltransferase
MGDAGKGRAGSFGNQSYFLRGWQTYRKVLDNNYIFHRQVYSLLRQIVSNEAPSPYVFLDIACGDAAATVNAVLGTNISHYFGIDISVPALQIAQRELAALSCPATLVEGDFRAALSAWQDEVNVAWIGQSLHHLPLEGKFEVMRDVRRVLCPGGVLAIWEPTLLPGESVGGWIARLDDPGNRARFLEINDDEWATVVEHSRVADHPETAEDWLSLGCKAGFASGRELFVDPMNLARVYRFRGLALAP